ncbi:MAG: CoA ester lyase [Actinobacteria bacterium]|nr:MAG: CoA ester lyase [Actinomycetota bacterium]
MTSPNRLRRSCLAVPGTSERALAKAPDLDADMVFVDLEDAVPAAAKNDETRARVSRALREQDWRAPTVAVRVNAVATEWWSRDVEVVVRQAAEHIDCIVIPKVESADDVEAVDRLLSELETAVRIARPIGLEAQIESARGLVGVERIAASSPRLETLVFGPGDYAASLGVSQRSIGEIDPTYPGDQWHYARSRIAAAAHAFGLEPIDGPYAEISDLDGLRESARRARVLGFQGKWVIHPGQIEVVNGVFSPTHEELEHALVVLDALETAARDGGRGATVLDGAMIDEASRRLAEAVVRRARAAGMQAV